MEDFQDFLIISHWPELGHIAIPGCKGSWGIYFFSLKNRLLCNYIQPFLTYLYLSGSASLEITSRVILLFCFVYLFCIASFNHTFGFLMYWGSYDSTWSWCYLIPLFFVFSQLHFPLLHLLSIFPLIFWSMRMIGVAQLSSSCWAPSWLLASLRTDGLLVSSALAILFTGLFICKSVEAEQAL